MTELTALSPAGAYSGPADSIERLPMKRLLTLAVIAALAGCGVETASTAATAASARKQEIKDGHKALDQAQQRVDSAMQQAEQRAKNAER